MRGVGKAQDDAFTFILDDIQKHILQMCFPFTLHIWGHLDKFVQRHRAKLFN